MNYVLHQAVTPKVILAKLQNTGWLLKVYHSNGHVAWQSNSRTATSEACQLGSKTLAPTHEPSSHQVIYVTCSLKHPLDWWVIEIPSHQIMYLTCSINYPLYWLDIEPLSHQITHAINTLLKWWAIKPPNCIPYSFYQYSGWLTSHQVTKPLHHTASKMALHSVIAPPFLFITNTDSFFTQLCNLK